MAILCGDIETLLSPYLDGELFARELADVEHHLATCAGCQARTERERTDHARLRALLAGPRAPGSLRRDVAALLDRDDQASAALDRRRSWSWVLPGVASLAAAAALALFVLDTRRAVAPAAPPIASLSASALQAEAAQFRSRRPPLVAVSSQTEAARTVGEYLRVPVTAPSFGRRAASLRGWQPTQLAGRPAATLSYEVEDYQVDIHVLDGRGLGFDPRQHLRVDGVDLWVSSSAQVSTVVYRDPRGVGYVFVSDMARGELIGLVVDSGLLDDVNQRLFGD